MVKLAEKVVGETKSVRRLAATAATCSCVTYTLTTAVVKSSGGAAHPSCTLTKRSTPAHVALPKTAVDASKIHSRLPTQRSVSTPVASSKDPQLLAENAPQEPEGFPNCAKITEAKTPEPGQMSVMFCPSATPDAQGVPVLHTPGFGGSAVGAASARARRRKLPGELASIGTLVTTLVVLTKSVELPEVALYDTGSLVFKVTNLI